MFPNTTLNKVEDSSLKKRCKFVVEKRCKFVVEKRF